MFGPHVLNRTSACSWCCQIKRNGYIYTGKGVFNTLNTHTHTERGYTCTLAESIHSRFLNLLLWRAAVALLSISCSLIPHFSHASSFPFYCQCRSSWCGRKAQPWLSALKTTGEILTLPNKTKQNKTTTKKQPLRRSSPCWILFLKNSCLCPWCSKRLLVINSNRVQQNNTRMKNASSRA